MITIAMPAILGSGSTRVNRITRRRAPLPGGRGQVVACSQAIAGARRSIVMGRKTRVDPVAAGTWADSVRAESNPSTRKPGRI
jgi:hypothetical protein